MAIEAPSASQVTLATELRPFDNTDPRYAQLLKNLQGNILKSHGRDFALHIFFRLKPDAGDAKRAIGQLRAQGFITSAAEQFAQKKENQKLFGSLLLTAKGLHTLGLALPKGFGDPPSAPGTPPAPVDMSFSAPMSAAAAHLNDRPAEWEEAYRSGNFDGLLILAYGNHGPDENNESGQLFFLAKQAQALLDPVTEFVHVEFGRTHVVDGEPREQFGFVDGISQPLYMKQDVAGLRVDKYDPGTGIKHLVVNDPFTTAPDACGSFYVFRKLQQNVKAFRAAVQHIATSVGIDEELAAGFTVGRYHNGDPVELSAAPSGPNPQSPPPNNFNYAGDEAALKCPFHAHVRKTNPRGDIGRIIGPKAHIPAGPLNDGEQQVRIARRGITYGDRAPDLSDSPENGVGLLFQCYQANIPQQFAFMQQNWANTDSFVQAGPPVTGQDPVIGQGDNVFGTSAASTRTEQQWPAAWNGPNKKAIADFGSYVTMKGGEFFFAPSIPTIESLRA